jgi:MoaA/NifB/PqqE/SkfB family radical SAM enzyme
VTTLETAVRTYPDAIRFSLSAAVSALAGNRYLSCLWELTYRCNARCAICDYWKHPSRSKDEMTLEQVRRGLKRIYAYGCRTVNFTGGEPTLRADLEDVVSAASGTGLWTSLVTNGSLMTRERVRALKEAGLDNLLVSFDSISAPDHDSHRGIPGLHARVVNCLAWIHEDFLKGHRTGGMMCVITRQNLSSLEDIVRFAEELGVFVVFQPFHANKTGDSAPSPELDAAQVQRMLALKAHAPNMLVSRSYLAGLARFSDGRGMGRCHAGLKYLSVDPYGYLHPCVDMPATGHILEDDIATVRSDAAQAMVDRCRGCWYNFRGEADTSLSLEGCLEKLRLGLAVIRHNVRNGKRDGDAPGKLVDGEA